MIVLTGDGPKSDPLLEPEEPAPDDSLPTFEESVDHFVVDIDGLAAVQDPPPSFSNYNATWFTHSDGAVISHDAHLNEDGEALYRFLLAQASIPPKYCIHIRGSHPETRTRLVSDCDNNDRNRQVGGRIRTETYTETITDFDFQIDLTSNIIADPKYSPVQWSVHDDEPAYRGQMFQQVDHRGFSTRRAKRKEVKAWNFWCRERDSKGLPPWTTGSFAPDGDNRLKSSRTVRQWCDDYCASNKLLKEFVYTKTVYGWEISRMSAAIKTLITAQTGYMGDLKVEFDYSPKANNLIIIRPTNHLSRALDNTFIKILLIIFLIYPFIWLYKRFNSKGGGIWKLCGGGYPFKVVVRSRSPLVDIGQSRTVYTEELIGEREGAFFKRWESTIRQSVLARRQEMAPLVYPDDYRSANTEASLLDGYRDDL